MNKGSIGRRCRPALAGVFAALLGGLSQSASGHSDPWGDIHPQVLVKDGNFVIEFNTSIPEQASDYGDSKPTSRMIYAPDGTLIAPRHDSGRKRSWRETGPVGLYGREFKVGDSAVIIGGGRSGKPGYLLKSPEGKVTPVSLPWPEDVSLSLFEDARVLPEGIAITGKEDRTDLRFYWFPYESTGPPVMLNLGPTMCIYDFPMASNLAFAGGKFWLAFMRSDREQVDVVLWSWKPGDEAGKGEILNSPGFGNSHLSLAAIGDRLCLAYHCVNYEKPGDHMAKIVTVFRKAE